MISPLQIGEFVVFVIDNLACCVLLVLVLELDRYIGNTHHLGRLWDNRNNRESTTIGDHSMPMFHDDITHRIHLAMGSIGHLCSRLLFKVLHDICL